MIAWRTQPKFRYEGDHREVAFYLSALEVTILQRGLKAYAAELLRRPAPPADETDALVHMSTVIEDLMA